MQLVIKNRAVVAIHADGQDVSELYPDCLVVSYSGQLRLSEATVTMDPRTDAEKQMVYVDSRRAAYPSVGEQLDMMYWDLVRGTHVWRDTVACVKARFPKRG